MKYRVVTVDGLVCQEWDTLEDVYDHAQKLAGTNWGNLHPREIQAAETWGEWETIETWPV